jgi:hypothetical protein
MRRAGWLAVPAIWPNTQLHYSTIALPGLVRFHRRAFMAAAALYAIPYPGAPVAATVVLAASVVLARMRAPQREAA